jgi:hypothetical protein
MKIQVDPSTDAGGFGYAEAGQHRLRVSGVDLIDQSPPKFPYLKWRFEFADPNTPSAEKNKDGSSKKIGNVFENTTLKTGDNAQFRLRQLCDAAGIEWGDLDTEAVIGLEFEANLKIDEYNGAFSNKIARFIPAG